MKLFNEDYAVDEQGNAYSLKYGKIRKLKSYISRSGYKMYRFRINNKTKHFSAHQLSYYVNVEKFDSKDGLQIDHIDGNKLNNNFRNLRRVTREENMKNPITINRIRNSVKGVEPPNKLMNVTKQKCSELHRQGWSISRIAKYFNCSRSTVKNRLKSND